MQRIGAAQRGEHGELTVGISVPFILLGEMFERFRGEYEGVSVEIVEGTSSANWALIQQRKVDVAFVAKTGGHGAPRSLRLRDERMIAILPRSHPLATARKVALDELHKERFILGAGGIGPDIEEQLLTSMARRGLEPRVQLHRVGQCNLINMVAMGFGVTIAVGTPPRAVADQVALVPLAGRNTLPLHAVWMESNPNPALTGLLDIVQRAASPA